MALRKLIKSMSSYISKTNNYTKEQEEQIDYVMRIMIFELLKFVGVVFIFSIIGYPIQAIAAGVTMAIIKPFIGGYHEDKQINCFIATVAIIGSIIYLSVNVDTGLTPKIVLFAICIFCLWNQAPVTNPRMPITREELLKRNRNTGTAIAFICAAISLIFYKNTSIANAITWTIIYQTFLMFDKIRI